MVSGLDFHLTIISVPPKFDKKREKKKRKIYQIGSVEGNMLQWDDLRINTLWDYIVRILKLDWFWSKRC